MLEDVGFFVDGINGYLPQHLCFWWFIQPMKMPTL